MTLKDWKARLRPGMQLLCVYRFYWDKPTALAKDFVPAPQGGELCELIEVRATQAIMKTPRHARSFMYFPRASELKADDKGFELYFPNEARYGDRASKLVSRYLWVSPPLPEARRSEHEK